MGVSGGSEGDGGCVDQTVFGLVLAGGACPRQRHLGRELLGSEAQRGGNDCRKGGQRSPLKHDLISTLAPQTLPRWLPDSGQT